MLQRPSTFAASLTIFAVCALMVGSMSLGSASARAESDTGEFLASEDVHYVSNCKGRFWPSAVVFQTIGDGDRYSATLRFQITQQQKDSLACVGEYLELDFRLFGLETPPEWDGYSASTNIPGGVHDTAKFDGEGAATPGITGIKVSDLQVDHEYYATISFSGLIPNGDPPPRVSFEWVPSHWAKVVLDEAPCHVVLFYYGDPICIFGTMRVYLSHGFTDQAYGARQSLVFDGLRIWEFPAAAVSQSSEELPEAEPAPADSFVCNDSGIPQITNGLSYSPENPDTATEVTFSFTISNIGCGTFQPEVLAIGGRDPYDKISDPLQLRDFSLGPGESREIRRSTVLSVPGTHKFFMVFLRVNGGWNEIPDTSGVSQYVYIDVSEAGVSQGEDTSPPIQPIGPDNAQNGSGVSQPEPPPVGASGQTPSNHVDSTSPGSQNTSTESCVEGAKPVVTRFSVPDDVVAYNVNTAPVYYEIEIVNRGCSVWDPGYVQVHDYVTGHGLYSLKQPMVEPGERLKIENFNYFDTVGTHTLYITADNGGVLVDESGREANLNIVIVNLGYNEQSSEPTNNETYAFEPMCHYYWSSGGWVENNCNYAGSGYFGEMLYEPLMDGCNYLYDGSYFYQNMEYGCN